jgi:Ni/Fe-hydrogenase subunit HybB-like protein
MLGSPDSFPAELALNDRTLRVMLWISGSVLLGSAVMGITLWFKRHFVFSLVIASAFVVLGMWLERWNIIVPTVTHPRLVAYTTYVPTLTEIAITAASFALLVLLPLLFFKLFPVISIWEVAEGRVISSEYAKVTFSLPESSTPVRRLRGFRRNKRS